MARPTKQGIDYFPLDCTFDSKTEMYLIETGAPGLAVLVTIWQMIYSNNGYYINDDDDLRLIIKRRIDVGINEVSDCINCAVKRRVFSVEQRDTNRILTSKAIQKRYFDAARKKKGVTFDRSFALIPVDSYKNLVSVVINPVVVASNATKVEVDVDVKVKEEVKVKELKDLSAKADIPKKKVKQFVAPDAQAVAEYMFSKAPDNLDHANSEAHKFVDYYESKGWVVGKAPMKSWQAAARNWMKNSFASGQPVQAASQREAEVNAWANGSTTTGGLFAPADQNFIEGEVIDHG